MKITTTELPLAAALQTLGFSPELKRSSENQFLFVYPKTTEIELLIVDYWNNELKVSPKQFWNNVRELKSRMTNYEFKLRGRLQKLHG